MSEQTDFYIAVAQIELTDSKGQRSYVNPGNPVRGLKKTEAERLLKVKALRLPTSAEQELEDLRAKSREDAETKETKKTEKTDGGADNSGNQNNGGGRQRNRGGNSNESGI